MAEEPTQRRLAAILAADVVGYSRLIRADEEATLAALKNLRVDLIDPKLAEHGGRIVKLMGDGVLVEFGSVVAAVRAATEIQLAMAERNNDLPEARRIEFRVGINLGDVVIDGKDIHGDGVNVAARLEAMAPVGGMCISGAVHEQVRDRLDFSFEDLGEQSVKNIDRPVQVWKWATDGSTTASSVEPDALALPEKPSIAVLPFGNLSADPEQEYFSDGISEDIITALARLRWLFVISSNSSFTYKGHAVEVKQVARELGVRYVLEGSVRKAGNRVRITAQLIEADTDHHVWAERFDRDLEDIFALQDEITDTIVRSIVPEVNEAEYARAARKPVASLDAWDLCLRGKWLALKLGKDDIAEARIMLQRALELDPGFAPAHAGLARALTIAVIMGFVEAPGETLAAAEKLARRAVELDPRDGIGHATLARIYSGLGEFDNAIAEALNATELSPNEADAHYHLAWALQLGGNPEDALVAHDEALRLNPRGPDSFAYLTMRSGACNILGRFEEAADLARRSLRHPRGKGNFWAYANLAAALGHLDKKEEAQATLDALLRLRPDFSHELVRRTLVCRPEELMDPWFDGLRKAGLPD